MTKDWYKDAVFYEVFVRAFDDGNGDGIGDLQGLTDRLDYLKDLGVDCLWLLPIYPSPLRDDGYDVADFYNIHPDYGTVDDLRTLVDQAHRRGLRVIADMIPNHTSDQHPWFQASRDPGHPEHDPKEGPTPLVHPRRVRSSARLRLRLRLQLRLQLRLRLWLQLTCHHPSGAPATLRPGGRSACAPRRGARRDTPPWCARAGRGPAGAPPRTPAAR